MDFERILEKLGLSLDNQGNIDAIGKSFCFYPREPEAQAKVGRVVMGRITGVIQTMSNNVVLLVNMAGVVPGRQVVLQYFPEGCEEIGKKVVPGEGWYIGLLDPSGFAQDEFLAGTMKFI